MSEPKPSIRTQSKQNYSTPEAFVRAVERRLGIRYFALDVCAEPENAVTDAWWTAGDDGLRQPWAPFPFWNWLNPPFKDIASWAQRAALLKHAKGIQTAMLVPASIDAFWWRDWVHDKAQVIPVSRMTFVGATQPFPKALALCLYSPDYAPGYQPLWQWKAKRAA